MIFTTAWWKGAGERALKTFVQSFIPVFLATLGVGATGVLNVWTAPWVAALEAASGLALGATLLSFCTSLGNADFTAGTAKLTTLTATVDQFPSGTAIPIDPETTGVEPVGDDAVDPTQPDNEVGER